MTAAHPQAASNANESSSMPFAATVNSPPRGVGEANRDPPDLAGVGDADEAQKPMCAHRHGAQAVGEQEVEAGRPRRVDIKVMCRSVAGHLGAAAGHLLVYMQCR